MKDARAGLEEEGRPSEPPPPPSSPRDPRFHPAVTVLATLLLLGVVALAVIESGDPLKILDEPGRTAVRVFERTLDVAEGAGSGPLPDVLGVLSSSKEEAEAAWREVAEHLDAEGDADRADAVCARLVVLLGEEDRFAEAAPYLEWMAGSELEGAAAFVVCANAAYGEPGESPAEGPSDLGPLPEPGWARRHLLARLGGATAATPPESVRAYATIVGVFLLLLAAGALYGVFLLLRGWRRRRRWDSTALLPAPWSVADGYAVLVRGAALGILFLFAALMVALIAFDDLVPFPLDLATLVSMLPAVWLVWFRVLRPRGIGVRAAFGLAPPLRRILPLCLVGLAALAIDEAGGYGISVLASRLGLESHWAEGVSEGLLFGSATRAGLIAADAVLWAPLFEEILFRGVLYATLRTRLGPVSAAIASAVLFSAAHFYSWPGFLVIFWSGLVWAVAYEKTRSIGPGIVAHALHNAVIVAYVLAVLR